MVRGSDEMRGLICVVMDWTIAWSWSGRRRRSSSGESRGYKRFQRVMNVTE